MSVFATIAVLGVVAFMVWFGIEWSRGEERARQRREDLRSGKEDFGDQPALFAVAQAIVKTDLAGLHLQSAAEEKEGPGKPARYGFPVAKTRDEKRVANRAGYGRSESQIWGMFIGYFRA